MVNNVEERGREARNQVSGANLKMIRSLVEGGKRWFTDVVEKVTLELEIPNTITTHPDGEEQFAESLGSIANLSVQWLSQPSIGWIVFFLAVRGYIRSFGTTPTTH
ncbi:unnamed protein product [Caenorhabditis brenneri]